MMLWKEVSWNPLASLPEELGWTSTFTQRVRSGAINDDVFRLVRSSLTFIVDGANAVSSFVMCSKNPWNMVVTPDDTTLACNSLRMHTSHFMLRCKEVSWASLLVLHRNKKQQLNVFEIKDCRQMMCTNLESQNVFEADRQLYATRSLKPNVFDHGSRRQMLEYRHGT